MTIMETYTPEEWRLLQETFPMSGLTVMIAGGPAHLWGAVDLFKESSALYQSLVRMFDHGAAYGLIGALRQDLRKNPALFIEGGPEIQALRDKTPEQVQKMILERLRQTAQVLHAKAEAVEAAYYRRGLLWVLAQVARAAHERGSPPGAAISEAERQAIRQVGFALGMSASEPLVDELPTAPRREVPPQVAGLLDAARWAVLRGAPFQVSAAILQAAPSGMIGTLREVNTMIQVLRSAQTRFPQNRLIDGLVDDLGILSTVGGHLQVLPGEDEGAEAAAVKAAAVCRESAALLRELAQAGQGAEAERLAAEGLEFRQMLLETARQMAESTREGGFLGLGGRRVSAEEQAVLAAVAAALELSE